MRNDLPQVAALVLLTTVLVVGATAVVPPEPRLLIYAHRGDISPASGFPENTLPAIASAVTKGADGVEFDLALSRDGTFWLMHDDTVDRTTNGTGRVDSLSDAQMRALTIDGGFGWRGQTGLRVPTLEEALPAAGPIALLLDIKDKTAAGARKLAMWVKAKGIASRTIVYVKSSAQVAEVRAVDAKVMTSPRIGQRR